MVVEIVENGRKLGYIKAVAYNYSRFSVTKNKQRAKKYKNFDHATCDIEYCSGLPITFQRGLMYFVV